MGTRDIRTQSVRAQLAHARLMFLPGLGVPMKVLVPVFYPPPIFFLFLVPGQARKPNTEECKLKIDDQVGS